jgi:hypothetical protein
MKTIRCLIAAILLCGLATMAKADDFKFQVLDAGPIDYTTINGPGPFDVEFGPCPVFIDASGCFAGFNDTGETFTTLTLIVPNTTSPDDPNDDVNYLDGQPADCDVSAPTSLFTGADCSLSPDGTHYILHFWGEPGITPPTGIEAFFYLAETGPDPSAFQGVTAALGNTPEPGSIWMLSTGAALLGFALFRRRRDAVVN